MRGLYPAEKADVFLANRESSHFEIRLLWRTDGTPEGTFKIHPDDDLDLFFAGTTSRFSFFLALDRTSPKVSLWRTDGTASGTIRLVSGIGVIQDRVYLAEKDLLFFSTSKPDGDGERDPWVTDGTPKGTFRLADVSTGHPSSLLRAAELNSKAYFIAIDPATFRRVLWRSDGTAAGTRSVRDFDLDTVDGLRKAGGALWVFGTHPDGRPAVWKSDGTAAGTRPVSVFDDLPDLEGAWIEDDFGDQRVLWLVKQAPTSWSLWVSDGTPAGTAMLTPLAVTTGSGLPDAAFDFSFSLDGGALYFRADDGTTGMELWRTDGTPGGTHPAFETCPGTCSDLVGAVGLGDRVRLWRRTPELGLENWISDGTLEGTFLLADLCPGPCSSGGAPSFSWSVAGWYLFTDEIEGQPQTLWTSDLTAEGTAPLWTAPGPVTSTGGLTPWTKDRSRLLLMVDDGVSGSELWAVPVDPSPASPAPAGEWLGSPALPGYSFKVQISAATSSIAGAQEASCIPETICVSGALPGRSEVFLRVVGPKPNGRMWPTLVKFSTSTVEVWVQQDSSGEVRYYRLEGARPGYDELPGLFDRDGFAPGTGAVSTPAASAGLTFAEPRVLAGSEAPAPPGAVFTSEHFPGFRFRARISAGEQVQEVRKEAGCVEETLCLSGALPGRSEVFVRIVGPKPNGRLWPTIVKFTTSTVEVWIEQLSTGEEKYYRIEGAAPGKDDLTGLFDREGFAP